MAANNQQIALILVVFHFLQTGEAAAFECVMPELSELVNRAQVIVAGEVISLEELAETHANPDDYLMTVRVDEVWRGHAPEVIQLATDHVNNGGFAEPGIVDGTQRVFGLSRGLWEPRGEVTWMGELRQCEDLMVSFDQAEWDAVRKLVN